MNVLQSLWTVPPRLHATGCRVFPALFLGYFCVKRRHFCPRPTLFRVRHSGHRCGLSMILMFRTSAAMCPWPGSVDFPAPTLSLIYPQGLKCEFATADHRSLGAFALRACNASAGRGSLFEVEFAA